MVLTILAHAYYNFLHFHSNMYQMALCTQLNTGNKNIIVRQTFFISLLFFDAYQFTESRGIKHSFQPKFLLWFRKNKKIVGLSSINLHAFFLKKKKKNRFMKSMLLNFRMVIGSFWSMDKTKIILNRLVKKKLFNVVLQYRYTHTQMMSL